MSRSTVNIAISLSWVITAYALTPWAVVAAPWLAGLSLVFSHALGLIAFGSTDEAVKKAIARLESEHESRINIRLIDMERATRAAEEATNRVSKAISEMRQDMSLR